MKDIEFIPLKKDSEKYLGSPEPSKNFIPNWYKESNSFITEEKNPIHYDGRNNLTFKKCIPIFDVMTSGYIFYSPCDIYALDPEKYENNIRLSWFPFEYEIVVDEHPPSQMQKYHIPENHRIFKWVFPFKIKTPPGYSCLFTHPHHRFDLPFYTMSGIVDTDVHPLTINFPFFLKNDFFGKISYKTPLVQILPFKRDDWKSRINYIDQNNDNILTYFRRFSINSYKKQYWKRKVYS